MAKTPTTSQPAARAASTALRLEPPVEINSGSMIWIAAIGILINAGSAYLFMAGNKEI